MARHRHESAAQLQAALQRQLTSGGQVLAGPPSATPAEFDLFHVIADSGFLFTRYLARRADAAVSARP